MAGAGFKTFNTGDVFTASDANTYLMQQTVMVFADASARTTALGANVAEGMMSYLKDTNAVEVYNGSAWVASDDPNAIQNTIVDAKGDLISATAADTPARLAVGTNDYVLTAASGETTGLKWAVNGGPAFRAWRSGTQSLTQNVFTKIQLNNESFDTDSCFDSTTNYRFTPTKAGYYQINATAEITGSGSFYLATYKNGSEYSRLIYSGGGSTGDSGSDLMYLNGSTDYLELYAYATGASMSVSGTSASNGCFMSATWVRN